MKKNAAVFEVEEPLFRLNTWHDVVIELRSGRLLLSIDGKKHVFESPEIDMTGHAQIDFKGIDHGTCQISRVRLYRGVE